jgi:hypothetical protein
MLKPFCLIVASTFIAGMALQADPIDPVFEMGDPDSGTPLVSDFFTFGANGSGGGILSFVNASGNLWTSLDFFVTLPINSPITCIPAPFFSSCQFSIVSTLPGGANALFDLGVSNPTTTGGIHSNEFFTINLNDFIDGKPNLDPNGSGGWGPDNDFTAVANASSHTPEPGTDALLVAGLLLAGVASGRHLWAAARGMFL